jgi:hypothetical protein
MDEAFKLNDNLATNTLFIVDEASMISDEHSGNFNGSTLLQDLVKLRLQRPQLQADAGWRYRPVAARWLYR